MAVDSYQGTTFDLNERVSEEVRVAMARFRLTQRDVAPALGVSPAQVSQRLTGKKPFTLKDIEHLAAWFQTTPQVLMGFADEPRPQCPDFSGTPTGTRTLDPRIKSPLL